MDELDKTLSLYDYQLTPEMIAQEPATPRDSSKLLVYDRKSRSTTISRFSDLPLFLPKGTLLVFNDTKVIPARIPGKLPTGARVEILCTISNGKNFKGLCERNLPIGTVVSLGDESIATVVGKVESEYTFRLSGRHNLRTIQQVSGTTPLPPYLKHSPLSEKDRRKRYQAVFAKHEGSIAAPTASLHFTDRLLKKIRDFGIDTTTITLHVNLGTFMPLTQNSLETGQLHEEAFTIPPSTRAKLARAKKVIAVGTTSLRALESPEGSTTRLFIKEGFEFKIADGLITNFHVPRSSLMMLVAALVGREKLLELYGIARANDFRFLSFGDAMLII